MSQQISRPVGDGTGKSKQTAQSSRALWMAHWMRNSTSTERRNRSPRPQQEELDRISKNVEPNAFEAVNDDCLIISPKSFDKAIDGSKIPAASNELSLRGFRFFGEGPSNSQHIVPYNNNNNNNSFEKYEPGKGKAAATSINDTFGRHWFQKRQGVRFLSAQTEDDKLNSNKKPQFDLETMRICTTVDSVQAVPGGCPRFSQTTHSLLITKKTDVNQENDVYRGGAQFVKRTNENASRDLKLSPFFRQGNRGVKIQPLSSSSNSQGRNNVEGRKVTIKNESSAETDTMEMDFCKEEKLNYGANSTPSAKALNINSNPPHRWINSRLPNTTNLELPALPAVESPPENVCPSSSRTQSLEMDMLLDNAERHHARTKPNLNPEDPDPSNPWVKRLKMSSPNSSSQGTKISSNPTEYLSHDKMRRYFKSILDSSVTDSDPSPINKDHSKETIVSDKNGDPSKEGEGFMVDMVKKNDKEPSLLSHVWIKRWLRNGPKVAEQKPDQAVEKRVRGPLDDDDELEKKQFPSIGAMAMMGKAMAGFHSCEVQKRGSFTVWNSKEAF